MIPSQGWLECVQRIRVFDEVLMAFAAASLSVERKDTSACVGTSICSLDAH